MPTRKATVTLDVQTGDSIRETRELDESIKSLSKHLGISRREAKKLITTHDKLGDEAKELARQERAAADASRKLSDEQRKLQTRLGASRKGFEAVQGSLGSMGSRALAAGEAVASIGPAGGIAAAGLLAVVGTVGGMYKLTEVSIGLVQAGDELLENAERLRAVGGIIPITSEQEMRIRTTSDAIDTMTATADAAYLVIADGAAQHIEPAVRTILKMGMAARDVSGWVDGLVPDWMRPGSAENPVGVIAGLDRALQSYDAELNEIIGAVRAANADDPTKGKRDTRKDIKPSRTTGKRDKDADAKRAAQRAQQAQRKAAAAESAMQSMVDSSLVGEAKIAAAHARRTERIEAMAQAGASRAIVEQATAAAEVLRARELLDLADKKARAKEKEAQDAQKAHDAEMKRIADAGRENKRYHDEQARYARERAAQAEAERQQRQQQTRGTLDAALAMGDAFAGLARARADSAKEGSAAQRKAAREAFAIEQASALTQAGIHAALAVSQSFAQLGPIAGAFAAVGAGATIAAQIATIANASPPQAHMGTQTGRSGPNAPDETMVRVRNGEVVQTAQQAQQQRPTVLVSQFRHKFFDTTTQDQLRRDGVLTRAMDDNAAPGVVYGV